MQIGRMTVLPALLVVLSFVFNTVDGDELSLRNFDGMYDFAWIGEYDAENLNVSDKSFLITFCFNSKPITRSNLPEMGIVCKKQLGNQPGYAITLNRQYGLRVYLNDKERESRGKGNISLKIGKFCKPDTWVTGAVLYNHAEGRLTIFRDGEIIKTKKQIQLGNLDTPEPFTIGTGNFRYYIRFRGMIEYAGVFSFTDKVPADINKFVAEMAADKKLPDGFKDLKGVNYSYWRLEKNKKGGFLSSVGNLFGIGTAKGADDQGNNDNFLYYMPENEDIRFDEMNTDFYPSNPKTIYVDINNPKATDDGEGSVEKPFRSIGKAAAFAVAGDTVKVKKGVYRGGVSVNGGRKGAPISVIAENGVIVKGTRLLKGWKKSARAGLWEITPPVTMSLSRDPRQFDARKFPGSLIYVNGYPLEWVEYVEDLYPGTCTWWPKNEKNKKLMTVYIFPEEDINMSKATIETGGSSISLADYGEFKNFAIEGCSVGFSGRGGRLENCSVKWGGLGFTGADHYAVGNTVEWGPCTGLGGGGSQRIYLENNTFAYHNWRMYSPSWHGGAAKIIPANIDGIYRNNTFKYSYAAGLWFDAYNAGNLMEYNTSFDNTGDGFFDEIDFNNTFRYNVAYNTWCHRQHRSGGYGFKDGSSSGDVFYRNITFNNERGVGIYLRSYASRRGFGSEKKIFESDLKYPHHFSTAERQERWLNNMYKYFAGKYVKLIDVTISENIAFNNHRGQLFVQRDYRLNDEEWKHEYFQCESDNNIFYHPDKSKMVLCGSEGITLDDWRKASGNDKNSKYINPAVEIDKLPEWARKRFDFKMVANMRSAKEIHDMNLEVLDSINMILLKARLSRSKNLKKLANGPAGLRGYAADFKGKPALVLWRKSGYGKARINVDAKTIIYEDYWLRRREVKAKDGAVTLSIGYRPVWLIDVGEKTGFDMNFTGKIYGISTELGIHSNSSEITLDGMLGDWDDTKNLLADMTGKRSVLSSAGAEYKGPNDISAKVLATWRPDGLLLAFDVTDDSFVPGKDRVEMFIDARDVWRHFIVEYEHPGVFHLVLTPEADGEMNVISDVKILNRYHRKKAAVGVKAVYKRRKGGYVIEMLLPWNKQNFPTAALTAERIARFGFLIFDTDNGEKVPQRLKWHAFENSKHSTVGWAPVIMKKD